MDLINFDKDKCPDFQPNSVFEKCTHYSEAKSSSECGYCELRANYRCLATTNLIIPLSNHSVGNFLTCHFLYYLTAIRGIEKKNPMKSNALKLGALWDAVLGKYYNGIDRSTGQAYDIPGLIDTYEIPPMEVAKIKGLYRAYRDLEINIDQGYELQASINKSISFDKCWREDVPVEMVVAGFYDRKYPEYFVENKLSSKPDYYLDPWWIQSQIGTYFLADESLNHCIMEVVRVPQLKEKVNKERDTPEAFAERIYQDVLSRPSYYFIGWDNKTHRYGKKYYRSEFNLEELKMRYLHIFREIYDARIMNGFYRNDRVCNNILPGIQCEMLEICRHGNLNEAIYKIREKPL